MAYGNKIDKNKAGNTATPVACGWAGAVIEVTSSFGQEQWGQKPQKNKKSKVWRTDGRTDGRTDKAGCRVHATKNLKFFYANSCTTLGNVFYLWRENRQFLVMELNFNYDQYFWIQPIWQAELIQSWHDTLRFPAWRVDLLTYFSKSCNVNTFCHILS